MFLALPGLLPRRGDAQGRRMAEDETNEVPKLQFQVHPIVPLHVGGYDISLTNSALWMLIALGVVVAFISMGMKRELVPGRWQMAVEELTGMIERMAGATIGPEGKKFEPL